MVDVVDRCVTEAKQVDGVHAFQHPAQRAVPHHDTGALHRANDLRPTRVDLGFDDQDTGHEASAEQRRQPQIGRDARDPDEGRIGMGVLPDVQITQVNRQAQRADIQTTDLRGVTLQACVELPLGDAAQRSLREERPGDHEDDQQGEGTERPSPSATHRALVSAQPTCQ